MARVTRLMLYLSFYCYVVLFARPAYSNPA